MCSPRSSTPHKSLAPPTYCTLSPSPSSMYPKLTTSPTISSGYSCPACKHILSTPSHTCLKACLRCQIASNHYTHTCTSSADYEACPRCNYHTWEHTSGKNKPRPYTRLYARHVALISNFLLAYLILCIHLLSRDPECTNANSTPEKCSTEENTLVTIVLVFCSIVTVCTLEVLRRALGKLDERSRNDLFYFCACIFLCGFAFIVFDDGGYGLERAAKFMVWPVWGVFFVGSGVIVVLKGKRDEERDGKGGSGQLRQQDLEMGEMMVEGQRKEAVDNANDQPTGEDDTTMDAQQKNQTVEIIFD